MSSKVRDFKHRVSDVVIRLFLRTIKLLPYNTRLNVAGWVATNLLAPLTGNRTRIRENLALVMPELSESESEAIVRSAPDSMGRALIEMYSAEEFHERIKKAPIHGPGLDVLLKAQADGRGAILVTGHFGNYLAARAALQTRGLTIGGLYKSMANPYFNEHYVAAMETFGKPMFERGRRGMTNMIRFLRGGGMVGVILDQRINDAPVLQFMGKPARTALSPAEMALKYNVDLVPAYGIRQADGSFEIITEAAIPHSTPEEMTQALNDSLEVQVRAHPGQWMWTHNRWKGTD